MNDGPQDNDSMFYPKAGEMFEDIKAAKKKLDGQYAQPEEGDTEDNVNFAEFIADLSREFDDRTMERHAMGAEKYGPGKFLMVDTLEEALNEVLDLGNYSRYTFIKLRLLQEQLKSMVPEAPIPTSQFIKSKDATAVHPPKE